MATLKKPAGVASNQAQSNANEDKYGKAYNNAQETGGGFPVGTYDAAITDYGINKGDKDDEDSQKEALFFEFTIIDGDLSGSTGRSYYTLFDKNGDAAGGFGFFKRDLAKLGHDKGFRNEEEMLAILEDIKENQPSVEISVQKQKNNPQYTNTYINKMLQ